MKKKSPLKKIKSKVVKHLKGDIKGYKHEAHEDRELISELKANKPAKAKKKAKKGGKVSRVMTEFSEKKLHSGSKKGPLVKSKAQALAIGLAEARKAGESVKPKKKK